jgi:Protease inhibitor Inh
MHRPLLIALMTVELAGAALAQSSTQAPVLGDSAKGMLGPWEFSNAERTKICTATFKRDAGKVGFKVEFDANCANLFPLVAGIAGWRFPDGDNLFLLDAEGRPLTEFSEVETGIYEAPTPGVGVLFLQNAAAAAASPKVKGPQEVAGDWTITRAGAAVCALTLAATTVKDAFALTVKPGCDPSIAALAFTQWQLDRGELVLTPARGAAWRFVEADGGAWQRIPESADAIMLVRQ